MILSYFAPDPDNFFFICRVAKMYGLYGLFFLTLKLYGLYGFLSWKIHRFFLIFTHFSKFFMKIKKNSRQNEVKLIFCILNNIRLINVSIDNQNSFIIFEICPRSVYLRICSISTYLIAYSRRCSRNSIQANVPKVFTQEAKILRIQRIRVLSTVQNV